METKQLIVASTELALAGRGIARIHPDTMRSLQLIPGDIIEIKGKKRTAAKAWRDESPERSQNTVKIDGLIRTNAGVCIGENVIIKKAEGVKTAEKIVLDRPELGSNIEEVPIDVKSIKWQIAKRPIVKGDVIQVMSTTNHPYFGYLGTGKVIAMIATQTEPEGITVIRENTEIILPAEKSTIEALNIKISMLQTEIGAERAIELLIQAIKDKDKNVRINAAEALGNIGEPAVEPLIQALKDEDFNVQVNAARALGIIGEPAVEPLIQALKDEDWVDRYLAIWTLGNIGDERAIEPLIQALKDKEGMVRTYAAQALGNIGDERAIEPLIQAMKDEYAGKVAKEALEEIEKELRDNFF